MSATQKSSKRKRNKKCKPPGVDSKGLRRGARRTRLDEVTKVNLGKGIFASFKPLGWNR